MVLHSYYKVAMYRQILKARSLFPWKKMRKYSGKSKWVKKLEFYVEAIRFMEGIT